MNELYMSDCRIYFGTHAKNVDAALDELFEKCVDAGIEIIVESAVLRDENGEEIEE